MVTSLRILVALLLTSVCGAAVAQPTDPQPILPQSLKWMVSESNPLVRGAWVLGAEKESGTYAFRVMILKGGKIPVHTHPDTRYSTVLRGTLYVGFGEAEDESKLVAVPTGGVYVAPAGLPHYLVARDGDVVYQEGGVGPTATVPLKQ